MAEVQLQRYYCIEAQNPNLKKKSFRPQPKKIPLPRLSNAKISEAITSVDAALQALMLVGWKPADDGMMVLPSAIVLTMADVRRI
jgi:hypothetical protein